MKKVIKIHQFDSQIYPRLLWITFGATKYEQISDRFSNIGDFEEGTDARVIHAYDKVNNRGGVLIQFNSKKTAMDVSVVTHESIHAAMEIFDFVGAKLSFENQEPFTYLAGWISKCIKEALNND